MIVEDRSTWWREIADHPAVRPHLLLAPDADVMVFVEHPSITPLRAEHGGFLFLKLDGLGKVQELHTMFTPEGWGREALLAAKFAFAEIFARGASVVTTSEVAGNWRSQPPKSFGFRAAGPFEPALGESLRTWILTREAWEVSPAREKMRRLCH